MTRLAWFLRLGGSRWWSGAESVQVPGFGGLCLPGLQRGTFPARVEDPLTRVNLELRPADLGLFAADPGALEAELRWGHGAGALSGSPTFLASRFFGRLAGHQADAFTGSIALELEHHLAFAYRRDRPPWSDAQQRSEYPGDEGFAQLPALARGDITGRWPRG